MKLVSKGAVTAAAVTALVAVAQGAAPAATSGTVQGSVTVLPPIKSVQVLSTSMAFNQCGADGSSTRLTFPNGTCLGGGGTKFTNNGNVTEDIAAMVSNATPPSGTDWSPTTALPGVDQFQLIDTYARADVAFAAQPTTIVTGLPPRAGTGTTIKMVGPSNTTNLIATTYSFTITLIAQ